jgi:hypothetical protein
VAHVHGVVQVEVGGQRCQVVGGGIIHSGYYPPAHDL